MGALAAALAFSALVAAPGVALAADPQSEVVLVIEANRFQPEEVRVKAGAPFVLVVGAVVDGATVLFAGVGLVTWHGWWMSRHAHAMRSDVQRRVAEAEARRQLSVLGLIAFTGVFREGAETVLFLWGLMSQTAEGASWWGLAGGVLGVLTAAAP